MTRKSKIPDRSANNSDRIVGKRLRSARNAAGMTQAELAKRTGVTFQQIQKYEAGTNRISVGRLVMICDALTLAIEDMTAGLQKNRPGYRATELDLSELDKRAIEAMRAIKSPQKQRAALSLMQSLS